MDPAAGQHSYYGLCNLLRSCHSSIWGAGKLKGQDPEADQKGKDMTKITPMRAIRAKCLECCAGQTTEVRLCTLKNCPLHPYRMGHRPKGEECTTERFVIKKSQATDGFFSKEGQT